MGPRQIDRDQENEIYQETIKTFQRLKTYFLVLWLFSQLQD